MTCDNIFDINKINRENIYIKDKYCFILIDTETCNGFDRKNNAVIQLAFMFLGTNYIYNSYCKPGNDICWKEDYKKFIPKIKKEDVNNSPSLNNVLISFNNIIHILDDITPILVAHNSSFDKYMLNMCFEYYDIKLNSVKWCNTLNKLFFDMKDENNKNIRSLEKITKYLFQDLYINFHDAKNDVENLNNCLLKVHQDNEKISSIVLKSIKNNDYNEDIFLLEYESIIKNFNEICISDTKKDNINELNYIKIYKDVLKKEKEISKYKDIIKNKIIEFLNKNNNYLCINDEEVFLNEYNMKQLDSKKIKEEHPEIYDKYIKNIKYKKLIIKNVKT